MTGKKEEKEEENTWKIVADGRVEGRADGMERSKRGPRGPRTLTFVYFVLLHIFLLAVIVDEKLSF